MKSRVTATEGGTGDLASAWFDGQLGELKQTELADAGSGSVFEFDFCKAVLSARKPKPLLDGGIY